MFLKPVWIAFQTISTASFLTFLTFPTWNLLSQIIILECVYQWNIGLAKSITKIRDLTFASTFVKINASSIKNALSVRVLENASMTPSFLYNIRRTSPESACFLLKIILTQSSILLRPPLHPLDENHRIAKALDIFCILYSHDDDEPFVHHQGWGWIAFHHTLAPKLRVGSPISFEMLFTSFHSNNWKRGGTQT